MSKKKPEVTSSDQMDNIKAVFIKRESHLGYKSYSLVVINGKIEIKPLHNSPDLPSIALGVAQDHLKGTL